MSIQIARYSEKSVAVFGDTRHIKEKMMELGGRYNTNLKGKKGWIFSKNKSLEMIKYFKSSKENVLYYVSDEEEKSEEEESPDLINIMKKLLETDVTASANEAIAKLKSIRMKVDHIYDNGTCDVTGICTKNGTSFSMLIPFNLLEPKGTIVSDYELLGKELEILKKENKLRREEFNQIKEIKNESERINEIKNEYERTRKRINRIKKMIKAHNTSPPSSSSY